MTHPTSRPRGGQPGNTNALKHGLFARRPLKDALPGLQDCPDAGLLDEITLLRRYMRRLFDLGQDAATLPETLQLLRIFCLASANLTRLIRTHALLASGDQNLAALYAQVLADLAQLDASGASFPLQPAEFSALLEAIRFDSFFEEQFPPPSPDCPPPPAP